MIYECRHCGQYIGRDEEPASARCPRCKEPIFEKAGGPRLISEMDEPARGVCALHDGNAAVGACKRCGNFFCSVCRARWNDRVLCITCVERLLIEQGERFTERQAHKRQAVLGFLLGIGAWILGVVVVASVAAGGFASRIEALTVVALMGSLLLSSLGIGQTVAALRARGNRMVLATTGLVLNSLPLGMVLGMFILIVGRA